MQAYKPGSVPSQQDKSASKVPVIYLAPASRRESIDLPTLIASPIKWKRTSEQLLIRAYLIFQPIRFTLRYRSPGTRWALTPPFHPYPVSGAVYFLWHWLWPFGLPHGPFPLGSMALYVARTFLSPKFRTATGRLAPTKISFLI